MPIFPTFPKRIEAPQVDAEISEPAPAHTFEPFKSLEQRFPEWLTARHCMVVPERQGFHIDTQQHRITPIATLQIDFKWLMEWVGLAPLEDRNAAQALALAAIDTSIAFMGEDFLEKFVKRQPATELSLNQIRDAYLRCEREREAKGEPTARQALLHVLGVEHCWQYNPLTMITVKCRIEP